MELIFKGAEAHLKKGNRIASVSARSVHGAILGSGSESSEFRDTLDSLADGKWKDAPDSEETIYSEMSCVLPCGFEVYGAGMPMPDGGPDLFLKGASHEIVSHGQTVNLRRCSLVHHVEGELAICMSKNDGGPLLAAPAIDLGCESLPDSPFGPESKVYPGSLAIGAWKVLHGPIPAETKLRLELRRGDEVVQGWDSTFGEYNKNLVAVGRYTVERKSDAIALSCGKFAFFKTDGVLLNGSGEYSIAVVAEGFSPLVCPVGTAA